MKTSQLPWVTDYSAVIRKWWEKPTLEIPKMETKLYIDGISRSLMDATHTES